MINEDFSRRIEESKAELRRISKQEAPPVSSGKAFLMPYQEEERPQPELLSTPVVQSPPKAQPRPMPNGPQQQPSRQGAMTRKPLLEQDQLILVLVMMLLIKEKADITLILAILYILVA